MTTRKKILPILFLTSLLLLASNSWAAPQDLDSADWSVKAATSLAAKAPPHEAVADFMAKLFPNSPVDICYARFADLRRWDDLSLVVAYTGGHPCSLSVFDKTNAGFEMYNFDLAFFEEGPEIKDLAGDGNLELIVPTDFTSYFGAQYCMAEWPVIYAWTGSKYSDVSSNYKSYYEQRLASLQKEIEVAEGQKERAEQASVARGAEPAEVAGSPKIIMQAVQSEEAKALEPVQGGYQSWQPVGPSALQPPAPPPPDSDSLNCVKAEAAKIDRFLGSRDAGMTDAIKWADSDDPLDREFAADVLADIGTPDAIEYLRTLSRDPDRKVAAYGKNGLVLVNKGPVVHTVDWEPVAKDAGKP